MQKLASTPMSVMHHSRVDGLIVGCMELEHDFMVFFMMADEHFKAQYYVNCILSLSSEFFWFFVQAFLLNEAC